MWPNSQESADLAIFTEEILIGKLHFLCSDRGEITDLSNILKTSRSVALSWFNLTIFKDCEIKNSVFFWSCFFGPILVNDKIYYLSHSGFFSLSLFLSQRKIPNFCRLFFWKSSLTEQTFEMAFFGPITRLSSHKTTKQFCYRHKDIYTK